MSAWVTSGPTRLGHDRIRSGSDSELKFFCAVSFFFYLNCIELIQKYGCLFLIKFYLYLNKTYVTNPNCLFRWFWKIVRNKDKSKFVAFIGSNYPGAEDNVPATDACKEPNFNIYMVGPKRGLLISIYSVRQARLPGFDRD